MQRKGYRKTKNIVIHKRWEVRMRMSDVTGLHKVAEIQFL